MKLIILSSFFNHMIKFILKSTELGLPEILTNQEEAKVCPIACTIQYLLCWYIHIFSNTIFLFVHVYPFCNSIKITLSENEAQSPELEVLHIWTRAEQDAWYLDDLYLTFSLCSTPPLWHTTEWWWWQKLSGTCAGRKWTSRAGVMQETAWQTRQLLGTKASTWSAH